MTPRARIQISHTMKLKINKDVSYSLEMADSHEQVCVGVVNGAQILTGDPIQVRVPVCIEQGRLRVNTE